MVLLSKDGNELVATCTCGCGDAVHLFLDEIDEDNDIFAYSAYLNGNWYSDQHGAFRTFTMKCKKIWRIIRNKDHHYSEILMTEQDFATFRDYVNNVWEKTHGET